MNKIYLTIMALFLTHIQMNGFSAQFPTRILEKHAPKNKIAKFLYKAALLPACAASHMTEPLVKQSIRKWGKYTWDYKVQGIPCSFNRCAVDDLCHAGTPVKWTKKGGTSTTHYGYMQDDASLFVQVTCQLTPQNKMTISSVNKPEREVNSLEGFSPTELDSPAAIEAARDFLRSNGIDENTIATTIFDRSDRYHPNSFVLKDCYMKLLWGLTAVTTIVSYGIVYKVVKKALALTKKTTEKINDADPQEQEEDTKSIQENNGTIENSEDNNQTNCVQDNNL